MLAFLMMISAALIGQDSKPQAPPAQVEAKAKAQSDPATPEEALRTFFVAMATKDEPTLRAVTMKTDDFDWLLKGQAVPPEHAEELKAMIASQPIRSLKVGDEFTLPGNRKLKVPASDISDEKAVLLPEGAPVPTRVRKVEGKWKVDASPVISGRKAAAEAAKKKAAKPGN